MANKKKSYKGKKQYAAYKAENRAEKNRAARLKRHLKRHPNDEQTAKSAKSGTLRSRPNLKGNFPEADRGYRDNAGNKLQAPYFKPERTDSYARMCGVKVENE